MKKVLLISRARTDDVKKRVDRFVENVQKNIDKGEYLVESCEISELFFEVDADSIDIYHPDKGFSLRDFDLVMVRHNGAMRVYTHLIATFCENLGIKYTDTYLGGIFLDNKIGSQFELWFKGVRNWPKTFFGNPREMLRRFSELGDKAILKDNEGAKGNLNFLVESKEQISKILEDNPDRQFVLQEFIPNSGDLRVLVLGGKVRMVIGRISKGESHLNNTSQGASASILSLEEISDEIIDISKRAALGVGLEVSGVDVMVDSRNGRPYLLEVNSSPQISSGSFVEEKTEKYAEMIMDILGSKNE